MVGWSKREKTKHETHIDKLGVYVLVILLTYSKKKAVK